MLNRVGSSIDPWDSCIDLDRGSGTLDCDVHFPSLQVAFNQVDDRGGYLDLT